MPDNTPPPLRRRFFSRDVQRRLHTRLNGLAVLVGLIAGLGAVVFRDLIGLFHNLLFFGRFDLHYDTLKHTMESPWGVGIILVPVIGALVVAFLVQTFAPEAKGHGVPEVMHAIYFKRGVIRPQVALFKSLASSISIGSGGAIGREGPIIQIGAAFGSALGQWTRIPEWERLALIACGAGGGIAATFNTPLGGILFAAELMLVEISARTLIPVMLATGAATFVGRIFFGNEASFMIPPLPLESTTSTPLSAYAAYALLGVFTGLMATVYTKSIYAFEDAFDRMPGNYYTRHVIGMALVGVLMYATMQLFGNYYIQGVGYATIQDVLNGTMNYAWLLLLLVGLKLLATSLTLGSGASGGVFSPSLFIGAGLGGAFALAARWFVPDLPVDMASAAVIGMACMVGASTGAAVTAVVMIFEMTRDYYVIIPLIIAVSLAYGVRRLLLPESIYTLKLSRRGQHIPSSIQSHLYLMRGALELIQEPFVKLPAHTLLSDTHMLRRRRLPHIVLVEEGKIGGIVPSRVLEAAFTHTAGDTPLLKLADTRFIIVDDHSSVFDLIARLRGDASESAVIVSGDSHDKPQDILGVITRADLIHSTNLPPDLATCRKEGN
jgi:chloride channel protein, CIC family